MNNQFAVSSIGYGLSLSDGNQWHLNADAPLLPWIDRFAAIMKLTRNRINDNAKLTYTLDSMPARSLCHSESQDAQINNGWDCSDLKSLCVRFHKDTSDVICQLRLLDESSIEDGRSILEYINMWHALYPIYRQSIRRGGLPFHAALVEKQGAGVLLAAPGDTGKSTCCRRLPDDWKPLCDDEALVVLDNEDRFRAHPFPTWSDFLFRRSDNTWDVQYSVPLCGVFFLEQSDVDETTALGPGEAAAFANQSATQVCERYWKRANREFQRDFRLPIFNNACELAQSVPAFKLGVSPEGKFWEKIEQALGW